MLQHLVKVARTRRELRYRLQKVSDATSKLNGFRKDTRPRFYKPVNGIWKYEERSISHGENSLETLFEVVQHIADILPGRDYLIRESIWDFSEYVVSWQKILEGYLAVLDLREKTGVMSGEEKLLAVEQSIPTMIKTAKTILEAVSEAAFNNTARDLLRNAEMMEERLRAGIEAMEAVKQAQTKDAALCEKITAGLKADRLSFNTVPPALDGITAV